MQNFCKNETDTEELAARLAKCLRVGDIICLSGDLGMGKSVFARALIRYLSGDCDLSVPSPTFTLVQTYETDVADIWHFDLYRLKDSEEIYELGWDDALSDGITLIEWPEKLELLAPEDRLDVVFSVPDDGEGNSERIITFCPQGSWGNREF